jgi:tetratricopeptide (TPR) repeat protein
MTESRSTARSRPGTRSLRKIFLRTIALFALLVLLAATAAAQGNRDAVALIRAGDYARAIELLEELRDAALDATATERLLAQAQLGYAYRLLYEGELDAAREQFILGAEIDDTDVRFLQGEALTWFRQGSYTTAADLLEEATVLAPRDATLFTQLGQALYAAGRLPGAIDALDEAVALGAGKGVAEQLDKIRREWQVEEEMASAARGHFQISYSDSPGNEELAEAVLDVLEAAYTELGADLSSYPDVLVPVLLYTRRDFSALAHPPQWAAAVYDGKIRLPLGGVRSISDPLRALLYHEYAHVLVHFSAGSHVPTWLNEGLAEVAGRRYSDPPMTQLSVALQSGRLQSWERLARPFSGLDGEEAALAYEQSASMVGFLVERFGWHKLGELLAELGRVDEWPVAVAEVYRDYGLDWPAIQTEWRASN